MHLLHCLLFRGNHNCPKFQFGGDISSEDKVSHLNYHFEACSQFHTCNVSVSEPHSDNSSVREPHTHYASMSEPHTHSRTWSITVCLGTQCSTAIQLFNVQLIFAVGVVPLELPAHGCCLCTPASTK